MVDYINMAEKDEEDVIIVDDKLIILRSQTEITQLEATSYNLYPLIR